MTEWGWVLCLGGIYWLISLLTLALGFATDYAVPFWPPAGVGVALLLLYGRSALIAIFGAALATDLYLEFTLVTLAAGIPNAFAATLQAYIGFRLARTLLRSRASLVRDRDITRFLLLVGPFTCLIAPTCGVLTRLVTEQVSHDELASEWLLWWSGDTLGVLLFAPLAWILFGRKRAHETSGKIGMYRVVPPLLALSLLLGAGHLLLSHI